MTTSRSKIRRQPQRGSYDRQQAYQVLDEGLVCHVGFVTDNQPFVIPMTYGREGDRLYLHGSSVSRLLQVLRSGVDICVTVTLLDGLVVARSVFHHSMNYRSVVLFGKASLVEDLAEKSAALRVITNHIIPQRWGQARRPNSQELRGTCVLSLAIAEVSVKVRTGEPKDDAEDYALPIWAGQIPLQLTASKPIPDSQLSTSIQPLENIINYSRRVEVRGQEAKEAKEDKEDKEDKGAND